MPSINDITLQQLENMSLEDGEHMIEKAYHISEINHTLSPSFVPSASNIPVIIMKSNGEPEITKLNLIIETAKQQPDFGNEEVTIIITGLPQTSPTVETANKILVKAYMQKIINLGATFTNMERLALLDVEQTGKLLGQYFVELTNEVDITQEIMHIVGQGIGAHVAGTAGREYIRLTGHQLRRIITALKPSKIFAKEEDTINGLAGGDADFVDAIHTSTCGMGTRRRVGDVDFYVNGPASTVPGATNVIEASMRATRYYAESVRPGDERNFPAATASLIRQYENNEGSGKRASMGIVTEYD